MAGPALKQISDDDVTVGLDGWLFLTGGVNETLRFYDEPDFFSQSSRAGWAKLLIDRFEKCRRREIDYAHIAPPEKLTIYPEFFPCALKAFHGCPSHALGEVFAAHPQSAVLQAAYVDLLAPFAIAKADGRQLYWKTDTHWTFLGAWTAYLALCRRLSVKPDWSIANRGFDHGEMILDLGGKLIPPVTEQYRTQHIQSKARRVFANSLVKFKEKYELEGIAGLHGGSSVVFNNDSPDADHRCVVVFGDSYAEYRPILLSAILAETFQAVHFIWSARIDWDYVDAVKPDIVISELAERFMNYVPVDDLKLDAFALERVAAYEDAQS